MEFAAELYMARNQQAMATTGGVRQGYGAVLVVVAIDAKNTVCFIEIT